MKIIMASLSTSTETSTPTAMQILLSISSSRMVELYSTASSPLTGLFMPVERKTGRSDSTQDLSLQSRLIRSWSLLDTNQISTSQRRMAKDTQRTEAQLMTIIRCGKDLIDFSRKKEPQMLSMSWTFRGTSGMISILQISSGQGMSTFSGSSGTCSNFKELTLALSATA